MKKKVLKKFIAAGMVIMMLGSAGVYAASMSASLSSDEKR